MDINEAALELKRIELTESQILHLQNEASDSGNIPYAEHCHELAQELILKLHERAPAPPISQAAP